MVKIDFFISCGAVHGAGHLSRSLALARAFNEGVEIKFHLTDKGLLDRTHPYESKFFSVENRRMPEVIGELAVVDGLEFSEEWIRRLKSIYSKLVVIDDLGDRNLVADLVVNPNVFASSITYGAEVGAAFLGPRYALIDPRFASCKRNDTTEPHALVTYGGGNTSKLALDVSTKLALLSDAKIVVAVGSYEGLITEPVFDNVTIFRQANMVELMSKSTLYVGSLGTSFLEAQAVGLSCLASPIVENQMRVVGPAKAMGAEIISPFDSDVIAERAAALIVSRQGHKRNAYIDGNGTKRVSDLVLGLMNQ